MSREKTEECPVCGEMFSPQGLSGHLRMAHGVNTVDELREDDEAKERDAVMQESQQTITLVDKLSAIGQKREEVEKWDRSNLFQKDEGANEFLDALDGLEEKIRMRLSEEEEIGVGTSQEIVSLAGETDQVFGLIDRFVRCRGKRQEVEEASLVSTKEAIEALDRVEQKIRDQLAKVTDNNDHSTSKQLA